MSNQHHIQKILTVLVYIQEHLDEELDLDHLSKVACISRFHFHRIFSAFVKETVHQYVKRLRMEDAASKLRYSEQKMIELALDYGFDTPAGFNKAFKKIWGMSPTEYRKKKKYKGTKTMEKPFMIKPELTTIDDIPVLFVRRTGSYESSPRDAFIAIKQFIKDHNLIGTGVRYFGLGWDDPDITEEDKLRFDACIVPSMPLLPSGELGKQTLKGGKYAVFLHEGRYDKLSDTFMAIYRQWLPQTNYKLADQPAFCEFLDIEEERKDRSILKTKIYIPIL